MRMYIWIVLTLVVLDSVEVLANIHGVLVNKIACREGTAHFNATAGTITSPLFPRGPPAQVSCTWVLHNPHQDDMIFSFSMFDLDKDGKCGKKSQDCCPHQWLMIKPEQHNTRSQIGSQHQVTNKRKSRESVEETLKRIVQSHKLDFSLARRRLINRQRKSRSKESSKVDNRTEEDSTSALKARIHSPTPFTPSEFTTTGHICGNTAPHPKITNAPKVIVKFFSDTKVHRNHMGFMLQFKISNNMTVCTPEEFKCGKPHLCIPKSWKCNGQAECPDGSDEEDCTAGCPGLSENQRCDGHWHCAKGEDELGCFGCDGDEWWCGEGTDCYQASRRCDGIADCRNQADEVNCSCLSNQTQCGLNSEYCYDYKTQRCDGKLQCPGGQDEIDCGLCPHKIPCGGGGVCYTVSQRCDGAVQCGDGSDEIDCTPQLCHPQHGAFLCANRHCIRDAWRCDQYDDCGDASDEEDCMRNSVIVAAAMGGLVCSLLLVIAVGCTCRLYALRVGLGQHQNHRGGRRSTPLAPLSRLEQHLLQREPPPSYAVAINDPSASLFSGNRLSRHWRRHRRRPPAPPEGLGVPGLPVAVRGRLAPNPPRSLPTTSTHPPLPPHYSVGSVGQRNSRSGDEKESEEEGKANTTIAVSNQRTELGQSGSSHEDDVPLLSAVDDEDVTERDDDAVLLEVASVYEDTDGEVETDSDDEVSSSTDSTDDAADMSDGSDLVGDTEAEGEVSVSGEEGAFAVAENDDQLLLLENETQSVAAACPDVEDEDGDVINDTKAAVLALSVVQQHTNEISEVDTELIPH